MKPESCVHGNDTPPFTILGAWYLLACRIISFSDVFLCVLPLYNIKGFLRASTLLYSNAIKSSRWSSGFTISLCICYMSLLYGMITMHQVTCPSWHRHEYMLCHRLLDIYLVVCGYANTILLKYFKLFYGSLLVYTILLLYYTR